MMLDALLQLSAAQAVTVTAFSTNTIDLGVARDLGPGDQLYVTFGVDTTATAAGAATVTFQIVTSANANLSSPTILVQSDAIPIAQLTAGRKPFALAITPQILTSLPNGQRYLGVQYTIGTGPLTGGSFTATVTDTVPPGFQYYASGFSVL